MSNATLAFQHSSTSEAMALYKSVYYYYYHDDDDYYYYFK